MELIDRYLQSVKWMLPSKGREDVIRELTDEILSQVEEKEAVLGRLLTLDEQAALLKQLGHPLLLASRYRKQRYLIDPVTFSIYWMVLRLVLALVFLGMALGAISVAATGQDFGRALAILLRFPLTALYVFGWITLIFVILDIVQVKFDFFSKWDPRTLPKLSASKPKHSMVEAIAGLVFGTIFGVWWLVGLKHQFWIFGPGVAFFHLAPVWQMLYPLFVVLVLASVARAFLEVVRPGWERGRIWVRLVFRGLNLLVLYFLIRANEIVVAAESSADKLREVMPHLNQAIHYSLIIVAAITVAQMAWDAYCLIARRPQSATSLTACF
jgi:hypothetical protein